jgi:hypothetical protein
VYHQEGKGIIWMGVYILVGENIIWSIELSSGRVCIIWRGTLGLSEREIRIREISPVRLNLQKNIYLYDLPI